MSVEAETGRARGVATPLDAAGDLDRRDLVVTGMTCASCVTSVEDALRGVAGVRSADVNLATERARVALDPHRADDRSLVKAVERAGYGALVLSADRQERAATLERERSVRLAHLRVLRTRLIVAAVLGIPTMLVSMADLVFPTVTHADWRGYAMFLLATPVQLWSAQPFYRGAISAARHGRTDMNTLIVVGTTTAYVVSTLASFVPSLFFALGLEPHRFLYYDTATAIVALVLAGRFLEARARLARCEDRARPAAGRRRGRDSRRAGCGRRRDRLAPGRGHRRRRARARGCVDGRRIDGDGRVHADRQVAWR